MNKRNRLKPAGIINISILSVLTFVVIMPFLWMLSLSFKSNMEIISNAISILPKHFSFEGYRAVAAKAAILLVWFGNSIKVTASVVILSVFTSAVGGYVFAKFQFRGKQFYFLLILSSLMVPFQVTMIPVYLIVKSLGLVNSLLALILPAIVSPFGIFLCKQFAELVPTDLIEAARIDGAGEFQTFFRLIMPQLVPILSALAIFAFMATWNDYLWPLIVLNEQLKMTIPLALTLFRSAHNLDYNSTMSMAVIVMIPVIAVFLIFQKQFIRGMTLTGMK